MNDITVLEEIILTTILRLQGNAYGVAIRKKIAEITNKDIIYGTLYNSLDQMLRKGLVTKERGLPTARRGGRAKIYYSLTSAGIAALKESKELHASIWKGLPDPAAREGS